MNIETGEVKPLLDIPEVERKKFISINIKDLTKSQTMRFDNNEQPVISPKDNRSILGRKRVRLSKKKRKNRKRRKS